MNNNANIDRIAQPFDTVKVRLQTQPTPPIYNGVGDCIAKTYKNEGFGGFYKGMLTPLLGIGLCVSIQFATLEQMKRYFAKANGSEHLTNAQLYLAGAASGTANSGPLDCVKKLYAANGLPGVFKGQAVTVVREFQGFGAYFFTYEWLVNRDCERMNKRRDQLETWRVMGYGALSGYALWITVYPIDVIKSKLQTDGLTPATRRYSSAWNCFQQTLKAEGVAGLYKGFTPCMLRAAPVNAVTFLGFETAMRFLGRA
ncbi:Mitochondrial carrier protein ymc2 [Sorochytrium milnesiophthora]